MGTDSGVMGISGMESTAEGGQSEPEGWFIPMKESLLLNGVKGSTEKVLVGKLPEVPSRRVTVAATSLSRTTTEPTRGGIWKENYSGKEDKHIRIRRVTVQATLICQARSPKPRMLNSRS